MVCRSTMTRPNGSWVDTGMEAAFQKENGERRLTILVRGAVTVDGQGAFAGGWAGILGGLGRVLAAVVAGMDRP